MTMMMTLRDVRYMSGICGFFCEQLAASNRFSTRLAGANFRANREAYQLMAAFGEVGRRTKDDKDDMVLYIGRNIFRNIFICPMFLTLLI